MYAVWRSIQHNLYPILYNTPIPAKISGCGLAVDGEDQTQCCASNGLTGECLGICSGNIINFPTDILDCKSHVDTYYSCYNVYQSTSVVPTVPGNVYLKSAFRYINNVTL